eukprot:TRINITY_DN10716_c0_g1_i1.p1 TRINITY_DN10716_c0_g1~~TRINITY_DN10716_c0_g1_i1.p1  ORF type:complete len:280 (-),score=110.91 TRINITY_DN10716_c0_g1_i1:70-909(-)
MGRCSGKGRSGHVAPKMFIRQGDLKSKIEEAKKAKEAKKQAWAASGVKVASPAGLPAGWLAEQFIHGISSRHKGKPFLRFRSEDGKHKDVCTVKKAIELHAADKQLDVKALLEDYEKRKADAQASKPAPKAGEKAAVEAFRAKHGALDRATIAYLPGWTLDSRESGNSGQLLTTFKSPEGEVFKTPQQVEAKLGKDMMSGKEVAGVAEAREKGKAQPPAFKGRAFGKKTKKKTPGSKRAKLRKKRGADMDVDMGSKPSIVKGKIDKKKNQKLKAKAMKK